MKRHLSVFSAVLFSLVFFSVSVLSAVPVSALTEESCKLDYDVTIDKVFDIPTEWNDKTDSKAVIKSTKELQNYLSVFYESSAVKKYSAKYKDSFFEDNVLFVNSLYQSYHTKAFLKIDDLTLAHQSYNVLAEWIAPEAAEDVESALLVQISVPKDSYKNYPVKWNITDEMLKKQKTVPFSSSENGRKKLINVQNIMQYPELPTGCESVSLTILLNHLGYNVDKLTIVRNYLPKLDFYWYGGELYGADFRTTFAGNPESENAYGCYAPCITTTANRYFEANGFSSTAKNITGADFDSLLSNYIDKDIPVLIWITSSNLHEPYYTSVWTTPNGERVQWLAYEHCVVLTGYDLDNNLIYVSDPLVGNTSYDYSKIKQRYNQMGQQAVYIETKSDKLIYGDVDNNGRITSADSLLVLRESVGLENFDDVHRELSDVDSDGNITSADSLEILRYSVGLNTDGKSGKDFE